ncbi:hypothetical protein LJ707_02490 [Mucilaginibacter sp. UR6-1]|nr:hypothetical protein [Mucilaginibacter sp. UR6-1]MCC8407781.1 hypothetical protein [Mucilaginibacter sp. UR6-1]
MFFDHFSGVFDLDQQRFAFDFRQVVTAASGVYVAGLFPLRSWMVTGCAV